MLAYIFKIFMFISMIALIVFATYYITTIKLKQKFLEESKIVIENKEVSVKDLRKLVDDLLKDSDIPDIIPIQANFFDLVTSSNEKQTAKPIIVKQLENRYLEICRITGATKKLTLVEFGDKMSLVRLVRAKELLKKYKITKDSDIENIKLILEVSWDTPTQLSSEIMQINKALSSYDIAWWDSCSYHKEVK